MRPDDFRVRTVDGVAEDWPFGYDDLLPYYDETDRQFGVSGLGGNPAYSVSADPPLPPLPIGEAGLRIARAHAGLGWHWWPAPNAIASSAGTTGGTPASSAARARRAATKGEGVHRPHALATRRRARRPVVTGATVRRIVTDAAGLACGAEWVDRAGGEHFQPADVVVLAANAIGSARLLLASADDRHPHGLTDT